MKWVRAIGAAAVAACLLGVPEQAAAQTNDEVFPQLTWNFATPGARANAMGRAFIGLADDATASVTNPAGLVQLTRPQVYVEMKTSNVRVKRLAAVDSLFTLNATEFGDSATSVPFFAVSAPIGSRFSVSFTRHEYLRHEEEFDLAPRPVPTLTLVFRGVDASSKFIGTTYAGSVAMSLTQQLQVGVSLTFNQLTADSIANRFFVVFGGDNEFDVSNSSTIANRTVIDASDSKVGAVVGALFRPNDNLAIGVTFTKGPKFDIEQSVQINNSVPLSANNSFTDGVGFPKPVVVHVPDRLGVGVSFRPTTRLLLAFDAMRVGYSSLAEDFTVVFDTTVLNGSEFSVDNVVEAHFGGEYLLLTGRQRVFVRAGAFTNPSHRTRFDGTADPTINTLQNAIYNLLPRETQVAGTVGVGITLGSRGQFDVAYVSVGEFVASIGVRFGS